MNRKRIGDVIVLVVMASLVALYLYDAVRASTHILNLILVLPLTVILLVLCTVQFIGYLAKSDDLPEPREAVLPILPVMALFAAYVLSLEWLGMDVGTFLFLCAFLWMNGERRLRWLLGYSMSFAALTAVFFSNMLPYPMPMLLLTTAY